MFHGVSSTPSCPVTQTRSINTFIRYKVVGGRVAHRQVVLTHRWYDPSQAFSIQRDVAKVATWT